MRTVCLLLCLWFVLVEPQESNFADVYSQFPAYTADVNDNAVFPCRILYFVITGVAKRERANVIYRTIGRHVVEPDQLHFVSDEESSELPLHKVISIPNHTSSLHAYKLSQLKWVYGIILSYDFQPFDWLVFLDDDTFIILNAFKALLSQYDANEALLLGKKGSDCHLICGGAGFALSRSLLQRLHPRTRDLEQHFEDALRRGEHYQSDVVISHYIFNRGVGKILHSPYLKNFPPATSLNWHITHNVTPSAVATFHRIEPEEYIKLYEHYYANR